MATMIRVFLLTGVMVSVGCSFGPYGVVRYPGWVERVPQSSGTICTVGFSAAHLDSADSRKKAFEDGIEKLAKSIQVEVHSVIIDIQRVGGVQTGSLVQERMDEGIAGIVKDKAFLLDCWMHLRTLEYYVLIGISASDVSTLLEAIHSSEAASDFRRTRGKGRHDPPIWIYRIPQREGYIYAVGRAGRHLVATDSRKKAEEDARAKLAHTVESQVSSKITDYLVEDGYTQTEVITKQISHVTLEGAEILERWEDPGTGVNYALARLPLICVKRQILEQAQSFSGERSGPDFPTREEVERAAERAFGDLEKVMKQE